MGLGCTVDTQGVPLMGAPDACWLWQDCSGGVGCAGQVSVHAPGWPRSCQCAGGAHLGPLSCSCCWAAVGMGDGGGQNAGSLLLGEFCVPVVSLSTLLLTLLCLFWMGSFQFVSPNY